MSENSGENLKLIYKMLISSIVFGIMFQLLFYKKAPGISCTILILVFYGVFFLSLKNEFIKVSPLEIFFMTCIILISLTFFLYADPILMFFNIIFSVLLIACHTITKTSNNLHNWYDKSFIKDILYGLFCRPFVYILKPFSYLSELFGKKVKNQKCKAITKVIIGVIIALPILIVVLALLSSADMVFSNVLSGFTNILKNINLTDSILRLLIVLIATLLVFSYLFSLLIKSQTAANFSKDRTITAGIDFVIIITVLFLVNAVYLLFTFIQFTYLFGSLSLNLPKNLTYAEYARRGFFELVAVTLINLSILLIVLNYTKISSSIERLFFRVLNSILVACTVVMLFSAHFRMTMYEKVYGYTYLRVFTHGFMFFILALLVVTIIKIWYENLILLKWYLILAVIAYLILNFSNMNALIAKNNIETYHNTGKIDIYYLTSLSEESIPYTANLYNEIKDKDSENAKILDEYLKYEKSNLEATSTSWQSFNISRNKALKVLKGINLPKH